MLEESVVDPDSAFQVNPDQYSIRIQGFDDLKIEEKSTSTAKKILTFFYQKLQFTYP
jgi:hypothetical protein